MNVSRRDMVLGCFFRTALTSLGAFCGGSAGKSTSLLTGRMENQRLTEAANELRRYGYRVNVVTDKLFDKDVLKPAASGAVGINIGIFTSDRATNEELRKRNKVIDQTTGPYDYRFAKRTPQPISRRHLLTGVGTGAIVGAIIGGDYPSDVTDAERRRIKELISLLEANDCEVIPPGDLITPTRCTSATVGAVTAASVYLIVTSGHKTMVRDGDG